MGFPKLALAALAAFPVLVAAAPASAVFIGNIQGGTDFPEGAASFADAVASFDPVIGERKFRLRFR